MCRFIQVLWVRNIRSPVGYRTKDRLKTLITPKEMGHNILAEKLTEIGIRKDLDSPWICSIGSI